MNWIILSIITLTLAFHNEAFSADFLEMREFRGNVCYDGDTCTTTEGEKIRLACIDTPEIRGERSDPIPAKEARDYLNNLVKGKEVNIRRVTEDRYGRTVGELTIDGMNLQQNLVNEGHATIYRKYSKPCSWANK